MAPFDLQVRIGRKVSMRVTRNSKQEGSRPWIGRDTIIIFMTKSAGWFGVIGQQLQDPVIVADNVYNNGRNRCPLECFAFFESAREPRRSQAFPRSRVKRTLVMAIECISAAGRYLPLLIV
jgi:hypothetical protein